jgi:hypothetical protein
MCIGKALEKGGKKMTHGTLSQKRVEGSLPGGTLNKCGPQKPTLTEGTGNQGQEGRDRAWRR